MSSKENFLDGPLLTKISNGDQHAFRVIFDRYSTEVLNYSSRILHSRNDAEEVLQEVFLKVWLMGAALREIENFQAFIRALARNKCLNVLRRLALEGKTARALAATAGHTENQAEEAVLLKELQGILQQGIDLLPERQKQVYHYCQQQGLKYQEAAEVLGLSPLTVQTHMKKALKSLRTYVRSNTDLAIILVVFKLL